MAISDSGIGNLLKPVTGMIGGSLGSFAKYAWVLIPLLLIFFVGGIIWIYVVYKRKGSQWTHKLEVRRVLDNETRLLSKPIIMKMRRFPLIKNAEVFELEKPLLGSYLFPDLDKYTGENEFSIVLDTNNRIFTNTGIYFTPDKNYSNLSARHAEIDIQLSDLKGDYQNIHQTSKRIEWATIAKYAFMVIAIIAVMVVSITAIQNWGEAQEFKAESDKANAEAMKSLAQAMETIEATVNTQKLEIIPLMKEIYNNTQNLQSIINKPIYNETV